MGCTIPPQLASITRNAPNKTLSASSVPLYIHSTSWRVELRANGLEEKSNDGNLWSSL